jgi:hypothetical protein
MATWDIEAPAQSGVGAGSSGNNSLSITPPAGFDGSTINSVTLQGTPTIVGDENSDDDIIIRWNIETSTSTNTYGSTASDAASICYSGYTGFSTTATNILSGGSTSPAPTTGVAADWHNIHWEWFYTSNGMPDSSSISWSAFTIRVDYSPPSTTAPVGKGTLSISEKLPVAAVIQNYTKSPGKGDLTISTATQPALIFDALVAVTKGDLTLNQLAPLVVTTSGAISVSAKQPQQIFGMNGIRQLYGGRHG